MSATNPALSLSRLQLSCEASVLEVLQGEIGRNFSPEVSEQIGFDIGFRFITRFPISLGPSPLKRTDLDVVKFICKEVWIEFYGKKIDRLQTNHRGTFMITDLNFQPLLKLSLKKSEAEILRFLALHKGMICGALRNLGIQVIEISYQILNSNPNEKGCCFTIKTSPAT